MLVDGVDIAFWRRLRAVAQDVVAAYHLHENLAKSLSDLRRVIETMDAHGVTEMQRLDQGDKP